MVSARGYGDGSVLDLVAQGASDLIGGGAASAIGASLARNIQFRTNVSPTIDIDVANTLKSSSGPSVTDPIMKFVKPTITLDGGALGHQVIAPYGEAGQLGWLFPIAGIGLVFGLGVLVGRLTK